jgi:hypothetical protein
MKIRLSRKIWQVVDIEVDLEEIDFYDFPPPNFRKRCRELGNWGR